MIVTNKKNFILATLALSLISLFLHVYAIANTPEGFFKDESSIGYNAWCISQTGTDEYGDHYPLFFRCFENYHEPVMVYSLAPLIKIFGPSKTIVRLPGVFFHFLASIAFGFLSWQMTRKQWLSLTAGFMFSILPWIFPLSRITMSGYTPMLFGICAGLFFLLRGLAQRKMSYMVMAAAGLTFAMYSHNCARPAILAFMIMFLLAYNTDIIRRWKLFTCFLVCSIITMIPMGVAILNRVEVMTSRFNQIAVWRDSPGTWEVFFRICLRYVDYFNPCFLMWTGDLNSRHNPTCSGLFYLFFIPLLLFGLFRSIKYCRHNPHYRFILLSILVYPVAAIFTIDRMHSTRSLNGVVFLGLLAVLGTQYLWHNRKKYKLILLIVTILAVIEPVNYMYKYFIVNRKYSSLDMDRAFVASLESAHENLRENETLYISRSIFCPYRIDANFKPFAYSTILFVLRIPPNEYIEHCKIPPERVRLRDNTNTYKGLLLVSNKVTVNRNNKIIWVNNQEPIPAGSVILKTFKAEPDRMLILLRSQ